MRAGLVAWEDGRGEVCSVESCTRGPTCGPISVGTGGRAPLPDVRSALRVITPDTKSRNTAARDKQCPRYKWRWGFRDFWSLLLSFRGFSQCWLGKISSIRTTRL